MPDPIIHSSSWTGPVEDGRQRLADVGIDPSWIPRDAEGLNWAKPAVSTTPEQRQWARLLGYLFLSPLLLLAAWFFAHAASRDTLWTDHRGWLILWTIGIATFVLSEFRAGKPADPTVRSRLLALALSATCAFACWYSYVAVTSHSDAIATRPERAFELYYPGHSRRSSGYYLHQRADGSTIEGKSFGKPIPYGRTCTLVQRLNGEFGFSWIRVLQRTPPPEHEIAWPIRREDCFSDKPIASLKR